MKIWSGFSSVLSTSTYLQLSQNFCDTLYGIVFYITKYVNRNLKCS